MHRASAFLALLVLAIPLGASAALPSVGQTILSGCRQGQCAWLRVLRLGTPRATRQGVLRSIGVRRGISVHPDGRIPARARDARIQWDAGREVDYAFCSVRRPGFAFGDDAGGLVIHYLDLFDLGGYQYSSAGLYMRICHGMEGIPADARLRRLGYRPGTAASRLRRPRRTR